MYKKIYTYIYRIYVYATIRLNQSYNYELVS